MSNPEDDIEQFEETMKNKLNVILPITIDKEDFKMPDTQIKVEEKPIDDITIVVHESKKKKKDNKGKPTHDLW